MDLHHRKSCYETHLWAEHGYSKLFTLFLVQQRALLFLTQVSLLITHSSSLGKNNPAE